MLLRLVPIGEGKPWFPSKCPRWPLSTLELPTLEYYGYDLQSQELIGWRLTGEAGCGASGGKLRNGVCSPPQLLNLIFHSLGIYTCDSD